MVYEAAARDSNTVASLIFTSGYLWAGCVATSDPVVLIWNEIPVRFLLKD